MWHTQREHGTKNDMAGEIKMIDETGTWVEETP